MDAELQNNDIKEQVTGKNILLVNDLPGYGKVALAAMVPILSRMGHYTFQLPTAVVSNTLDYGKFCIQDMTGYMKDTLAVWKGLGFEPDCICTGFIVSEGQADLIGEYIQDLKSTSGRGQRQLPLVVVDPIMADGGKLYNGIGQERVLAMRKLAAHADVMMPNITEASFLTGIRPGQENGTQEELRELTDGLREISGKSVVITSAVVKGEAGDSRAGGEKAQNSQLEGSQMGGGKAAGTMKDAQGRMPEEKEDREGVESGRHLVYGYDHWRQEYFQVPYEYLPVRVAGSGDIFSAIVTGGLLAGKPLKVAVEKAVQALSRLIVENRGHLQGYKGILVERYWDILGTF